MLDWAIMKANKDLDLGGHISTYSSAATLYEVGFNHFFRGSDNYLGDMIKPIFDKLENTDLSAAEKYGFLKKAPGEGNNPLILAMILGASSFQLICPSLLLIFFA